MTLEIIVLIVVVIVAVLLAAYAVAMMRRNKQGRDRRRADELRHEAQDQATGLRRDEARVRQDEAAAAKARADAEAKLAEADRAEALANERRGGLHVQRGRQEDAVRSADQLDPDVDHKAEHYEPEVPPTRPVDNGSQGR